MNVNPIWPKGRIDACKSYMAQGAYIRCMQILYGPRDVYSLYVGMYREVSTCCRANVICTCMIHEEYLVNTKNLCLNEKCVNCCDYSLADNS